MKPKLHASRFTSLSTIIFAGVLASAGSLHAAAYFWDNNDIAPGFGTAGGTWTVPTVSQWSTDTTGVAAPGASITTATTDTTNFGTGTAGQGLAAGTITVTGTVNSGSMTFGSQSGAIVLSGGTINLAAATTITLNNASDTIDSNLTGAATSLTKAGTGSGTLNLSGTNTYSGPTILSISNPGSNIVFQGLQSLSTTTTLTEKHPGGVGGFGSWKLLDDAASPASRSGVNINESSSNTTHGMTLFVGNNSVANGGTSASTQTGSTIILGNLTMTQNAVGNTSQNFQVTGANGYGLQIGSFTPTVVATLAAAYTVNLIPISAPITITGTVQQAAGNTGTAGVGNTLTVVLDGNASGNLISGTILNSATQGRVMSVFKNNTSTWTLSGNNTYSGVTTVQGIGTLILSGDNIGAAGGVLLNAGASGSANIPKLHINTATALGTGTLTFGGGLATDKVQFDNSSGSTLNLSTNNVVDLRRDFTFVGSNSLNLGTGATTLNGVAANGTRNITVTANTLTMGGTITEGALGVKVTKLGAGTLVLSGSNAFTGVTTVSAGKLFINGDQTLATGAVNVSALATLGGTGTLGGDTTIADTGKLEFDLSTAAGSHNKLKLAASKTLTFSGASTLTITSGGGASPGLYTLVTATGASSIIGAVPATVNLPATWTADSPQIIADGPNTSLVINITSTGGGGGGSTYSAWQSANNTSQTIDQDLDNDGVANGIEYFISGPVAGTGFTALPPIVTTGGVQSITFTHAASYTGVYGTDFSVETSTTLGAGSWTTELGGNVTFPTATTVKYTFPAGTMRFARLKVTGP